MTSAKGSLSGLRYGLFLSLVCFAMGLFAPCITLHPHFGELSWLVEIFAPQTTAPKTYSIVGGIWTLLSEGNVPIGLVIFAFSVVFPTWKIMVLWKYINHDGGGARDARYLSLVSSLGKFSMLDVFVLGLLVLAIKGLPGGSQVEIRWGAGCFTLSVLVGIVVSIGSKRLAASEHGPGRTVG